MQELEKEWAQRKGQNIFKFAFQGKFLAYDRIDCQGLIDDDLLTDLQIFSLFWHLIILGPYILGT